jgi:hypothetical protein
MTEAQWLRVSPDIRSFVLGEVERQHWHIGTPDYARRVEWMTDAWTWAQLQAASYENRPYLAPNPLGDKMTRPAPPTVDDILFIAGRIEPGENKGGYRRHGVQVGDRTCPGPDEVPMLVERLWQHIDSVAPITGYRWGEVLDVYKSEQYGMTADDFYLEFERIHPFGDGNGRTGKILHNWLLGTLDKPVLVADYFGGGNP